MFRYRLRTLLIATTIGPPILAAVWLFVEWLMPEINVHGLLLLGSVGYGGLITLAIGLHHCSPSAHR